MKLAKTNTKERQTYVDRGSGIISLVRPNPVPTRGIYKDAAVNRFPDDRAFQSSIDNAWAYLESKGLEKKATTSDLIKAAFTGGAFVGAVIITIIGYYIGLL